MEIELFTIEGKVYTGKFGVREMKRGGKQYYYTAERSCCRCGGVGGRRGWPGWTCYRCHGTGVDGIVTIRLYTAEQLAKALASKEKREAKAAAKAAEKAAAAEAERAAKMEAFLETNGEIIAKMEAYKNRSSFIADVLETVMENVFITDKQKDSVERAIAKIETIDNAVETSVYHPAEIGTRIDFEGNIFSVAEFHQYNSFTFRSEVVFLTTVKTTENYHLVIRTNKEIGRNGDVVKGRGTIKAHKEYKGIKQTVLNRAKIEEKDAE